MADSAESNPVNLLIGTPAYGNQVHTEYATSLIQFKDAGIPVGGVLMLGNESLITRARNTLLSIFHYEPAFTHLLFLDADIRLTADGLNQLIAHQRDVIGARVPLKGFGTDGKPLYNAHQLQPLGEGLYSANHLGTAVMLLSRRAADALVAAAEERGDTYPAPANYAPGAQWAKRPMYDAFKVGVYDGHYLSEDYYACRTLQQRGFTIHVDPAVRVVHHGMFAFKG